MTFGDLIFRYGEYLLTIEFKVKSLNAGFDQATGFSRQVRQLLWQEPRMPDIKNVYAICITNTEIKFTSVPVGIVNLFTFLGNKYNVNIVN
jgi:hypothetical protein